MKNLMPAEWEKHERTWLAFPHAGYTLGNTVEDQEIARQTWANVANATSDFEKVTLVVHPKDVATAKKLVSRQVEVFEAELDDAWIRDSGPTFVRSESGDLQAVNWVFNGWGNQSWAEYSKDALIATEIAKAQDIQILDSPMVNEGGGIHVDGTGRVLLTKTVQLDQNRNPGWDASQVEAELERTIGGNEFIWLDRGLTRDYDEFGTRGHVDIVACFAPDGRIIYHDQQNPNHPDFAVSSAIRDQLIRAGMELVGVPAPETLRDDVGFVDYSYINHYVLNHGVILGSFDDKHDKEAKSILRDCYPGREIVMVDARELFARGGGIHCITQQQPISVATSAGKG